MRSAKAPHRTPRIRPMSPLRLDLKHGTIRVLVAGQGCHSRSWYEDDRHGGRPPKKEKPSIGQRTPQWKRVDSNCTQTRNCHGCAAVLPLRTGRGDRDAFLSELVTTFVVPSELTR
jgi:hypothetical protein